MTGSNVTDVELTAVKMGRALALRLDELGMAQSEFARRIGASEKHVSLVLNGVKTAHMATLDYWAFCLGARFQVTLSTTEMAEWRCDGCARWHAMDETCPCGCTDVTCRHDAIGEAGS